MFGVPIWAQAAGIGAVALFSGFIGYRVGDAHTDRVLNKIQNNTIIQHQKADAISQTVGEGVTKTVERIRWNTVTLHEEVQIYVPPKVDVQYAVPAGFVRLFNASVEGVSLPESPAEPVDQPSGVAFSTLAATSTFNNSAALECQALLKGWQDWAHLQQALSAK